ncbi:MAG: hypothetical protein ACPG4N_03980 [Gammaproteobacteria bacterium]
MLLTLPVRLKEDLPEGFDYPIWPSVMTEALRDAPQLEDAELVFRLRDKRRASEWQHRIDNGGDITLLQAEYRPHHSPYFPKWKITINAVPSAHLPKVRAFLRNGGLAEFAQRLSAHETAPNYSVVEKEEYPLGGKINPSPSIRHSSEAVAATA